MVLLLSHVLVAILVLVAVQHADAHSQYREKVPNGGSSPGNCNAWGHTGCGSGGNNWGGSTVVATGTYDTSKCTADPDGDGFTTGEELGDACCYGWTSGTVDNTKGVVSLGGSDARISNPRNPASTPVWASNIGTSSSQDIHKYTSAAPGTFTVSSAQRSVRFIFLSLFLSLSLAGLFSFIFFVLTVNLYFVILLCSLSPLTGNKRHCHFLWCSFLCLSLQNRNQQQWW